MDTHTVAVTHISCGHTSLHVRRLLTIARRRSARASPRLRRGGGHSEQPRSGPANWVVAVVLE